MTPPETKRCSTCKTFKVRSAFYKSQWRNGAWCKVCCVLKYTNNKEKVRWQCLKRAYGIAKVTYMQMFEAQGGVCAICKKPEGHSRFKNLAVDHDHETGKVRSLLCHRCNAGLGNFYDALPLLREAVRYLDRHSLAYASHEEFTVGNFVETEDKDIHSREVVYE